MTMRPFSRKKQMLFDVCILVSILAAVLVTYFSISRDIYDVFPYFYLIPIILIAFSRPKLSIYGTVIIGWLYLALVYLLGVPDLKLYALATVWFYIFVSLGVLISTYSQVYRKEGDKNCGVYYNSQAGIFSYDRDTLKIRDANRKFAHMIRYECDELMKKSLPDLIPDTDERKKFIDKIRDLKRVGDIEVRFRAWDGSMRWALVSAAETGEPGVICTVVDITDSKLAQEALTQANKKLNLLNNITRHDILNQLTALLGYIEIAKQDNSDPAMTKYIEKEESAANAIRSQILFTRDYQNIGVHSPQWHNIAETVTLATASIDLRSIVIRANIPPVEIYADPLLEKVFYNLIENSIRHGQHVTEISVRTVERADNLDIIIEDNGVGVPDAEKEHIFRREYFKNTGFGLFLSREILAITNLTLSEAGTPGKGARFIIRVPREHFRSIAD
ncbi:PAS domain-containing sensor histidine kinase [Methanoregula sp.]|uniref:ATP-binding protein n=1 Tax=Methanoregula sp. TaxID=2052170 RepID=UPI00237117AB|nr:PAS domain-containing sensor histidine kinase [Methanoregula sp.]MDD1685949.1 PAS domain-containing sensor histidine kinase [Methanoregula sp.]